MRTEGREIAPAASIGGSGVEGKLALALALAIFSAGTAAQVLNDPTRPPASFGTNAPDTGAGGGIMLQSVLISPTHRAAIINGVLVPVGGKYGGAVLVEVNEKEAVLKSGGSRQVLKLHPGVDMKEIGSTAGATAGKAQSGAETAGGNIPVAR
jgi:MSHA biogenesis protein MshK